MDLRRHPSSGFRVSEHQKTFENTKVVWEQLFCGVEAEIPTPGSKIFHFGPDFAERQLMGSESLDGGIFWLQPPPKVVPEQRLCFQKCFCVQEHKTSRRVTAKVRSTAILPQDISITLTDT